LKSRASYILRVPDIEIPTIPQKEMWLAYNKNVVCTKEYVKRVIKFHEMQKIFLDTSITPEKGHIPYIVSSKKNVSFSSNKSTKLFIIGLAYAYSAPLF
jgi:hypothetical protein